MAPEIGETEVLRHKQSLTSKYPTATVVNKERKVGDELFTELKQYSKDGYPELKDYSEDGYIGVTLSSFELRKHLLQRSRTMNGRHY